MATVTEPAVSGGADGAAPEPPNAARAPVERPREIGGWSADDLLSLAGSLAGSLALVWLLYERVFGVSGAVGFLVCWYLAFIGTYVGVSALGNPWVVVKDRLSGAVV